MRRGRGGATRRDSPPRRDHDGSAHAGHRRYRRHGGPARAAADRPGAGADHLRRRGRDRARAAGWSAGLPHQGRQRRADRSGDPRGLCRADPPGSCGPGTARGHGAQPARGRSRTRAQTTRRAHRPRDRGAHAARVGPEQRRDRRAPLPQQRHG